MLIMDKEQIKKFFELHAERKSRTIVIVDFGNVEKWKHGLGWNVGVRELATLIKNFSMGKQFLRRFYYGADYGPDEKSSEITHWSKTILDSARNNGFEVMAKRVKYIRDVREEMGYQKKCDLDVEMAIDLVREKDAYDNIVVFSGDGDLMYAVRYLVDNFEKKAIVMSARGHVGREVLDAKKDGILQDILFAEDFAYRLDMNRIRPGR